MKELNFNLIFDSDSTNGITLISSFINIDKFEKFVTNFFIFSSTFHNDRHALLFGITCSIVYNVHHETKENFNEACITTRPYSCVKENFFCVAC